MTRTRDRAHARDVDLGSTAQRSGTSKGLSALERIDDQAARLARLLSFALALAGCNRSAQQGVATDLAAGLEGRDGAIDLCMFSSCDPLCPPPDLDHFVACLSEPEKHRDICGCSDVGHVCVYFEQDLTCACDHLYHCSFSAPGGCGDAGMNVVCPDGG